MSKLHKQPAGAAAYLALAVALGLLASLLPPAAAEPPGDEAIARAVTQRLLDAASVDDARIDVSADQGVVSLVGTVDNVLAKERVQRLAETVKGVRAVVNRLEVDPVYVPDEKLVLDVEEALALDPATERYEVDTHVTDQRVTLTGTVQSWAEKRLAGRVAKGVEGVKGLDNRIGVNLARERPDPELEKEVEEVLAWDALVDDDQVVVTVEEGEVHLTGHVASLAEKRRAREQARVTGVKAVDASRLKVASWARDPRYRKHKYAKLDKPDAVVAKAVRAALERDPRVPPGKVGVLVKDGQATLTGTVDNVLSKRAAARDARNTLGVETVRNRIQVRPGTPSDDTLEERAAATLARHPEVDEGRVQVSVRDGVARLEGSVESFYERAVADNAIAGLYGVLRVDNELEVRGDQGPYGYSPYADWEGDPRAFAWGNTRTATVATPRSDMAILKDVQDQLHWSPYVNESEVTVAVDDGVVTLTGTVDSWSERNTATASAYRGGASFVDNHLRVRRGPDRREPKD